MSSGRLATWAIAALGAFVVVVAIQQAPSIAAGGLLYPGHGIADNRSSVIGVISRFTARDIDVVAYDSRRHGARVGKSTCDVRTCQPFRRISEPST